MLNVLNYSRSKGGKRRRGEFISYQPWAKTNKILLTYLMCISTESTSRQLFSSYLTGLADHQMPPRLAYARTFPTLTHNQSRSIKYFFITMHLSQNFLGASPSPTPWLYSQCRFFQINWHLPSPNSLYRRAHQPQDVRHACLPHLAQRLGVQTGCPSTWSFFWTKPRIRMLETGS